MSRLLTIYSLDPFTCDNQPRTDISDQVRAGKTDIEHNNQCWYRITLSNCYKIIENSLNIDFIKYRLIMRVNYINKNIVTAAKIQKHQ